MASVGFLTDNLEASRVVAPVSLSSEWITAIEAGGMVVQDNATPTNPLTQITSGTRNFLKKGAVGTLIVASMAYSSGITLSVSPIVKMFGRYRYPGNIGRVGRWMTLPNIASTPAITTTITVATSTDDNDGAFGYTLVTTATTWDSLGTNEYIFAVSTIFAVSVGSAATAFLQAKII